MIPIYSFRNFIFDRQLKKYIKYNKIPKNKIIRSDHHRSHAACAFYSSGWEKVYTLLWMDKEWVLPPL